MPSRMLDLRSIPRSAATKVAGPSPSFSTRATGGVGDGTQGWLGASKEETLGTVWWLGASTEETLGSLWCSFNIFDGVLATLR